VKPGAEEARHLRHPRAFRRRSGRRRPGATGSPCASAACLAECRSRDHAQRQPAAGNGGRLTADHLKPPEVRAEERLLSRDAT